MRPVSKKTAARVAECREFREQLKRDTGHCEICGYDSELVTWGEIVWTLDVHEIARGAFRDKAMDKPYAVLVVCRRCHVVDGLPDPAEWPEARQLACLMASRLQDYDLVAYNRLVNPDAPRRITQTEVDAWLARDALVTECEVRAK